VCFPGFQCDAIHNLILVGYRVVVGELKELTTIVELIPLWIQIAREFQIVALLSIGTAWIATIASHFVTVGTDKRNVVSIANRLHASNNIISIHQDEFFKTRAKDTSMMRQNGCYTKLVLFRYRTYEGLVAFLAR
jgi:hypothetical protein